MKPSMVATLALSLFLAGSPLPLAATGEPALRITDYVLVGKTRVSPGLWHQTYRASLVNRGTRDLGGATAETRTLLDILVVDGRLTFGPVQAGRTVPSLDTFTLRLPFSQPLDSRVLELILRWSISTGNAAPIAEAGPEQSVARGATVQLDGRGSRDPEGHPLTWRWSFSTRPSGSLAALEGAATSMPTFVADRSGRYDVTLVVNDGLADSAPDSVPINALNSAPIADAGDDQAGTVGQSVTLDGVGSNDGDGDPLTFAWSLVARPDGSAATLSDAGQPNASFIPDRAGEYVVQLIVDDGYASSAPDTTIVTISEPPPSNRDPQITSVAATTGQSGTPYLHQVVAADPDGDPLAYTLLVFPDGMTLSAAGLVAWTPDQPGRFDVTVEVTDGRGGSASQSWSIEVAAAPGVPPPTVTVDPTVPQEIVEVPGFDGGAPRPVVALTDRSNIPLHFVANELIVVSNDADAVAELANRYGGTLVSSFVPGDYGIPGTAQHLIRIEPGTVDAAGLVADLQALEPEASNALRVSNDAGLRLLAAAARESAAGTPVGLNIVAQPFGYEERTTAENASLNICASQPPTPPVMDSCVWPGIANTERFESDAYKWSYMTGTMQNIGVGEAWRSLSLSGMLGLSRVKIAVLDGGFSPAAVDNPVNTDHHDNGVFEDIGFPPNEMTCTNGVTCRWHGANVVSAAMGPADDGRGAAGPGGPVADAETIRYSGDNFVLLRGIGLAVINQARIINMSFGWRTPATLSWSGAPFNLLTEGVTSLRILLVAASGNNNADVDSEDCVPISESPCWEDAWWAPCENDGVLCVGALADNATGRRGSSNWGAEDVDLFAPGTVWVGGDPDDPEPHQVSGTSISSPFVAGVAALVMVADQQLSGDDVSDILIQTARTSPDGSVRRYVDALAAVNQALGGSPVCTPPTIMSAPVGIPTVPCVERVFEVTHTQKFGPFRYQWRKLIAGTNDWVDLPDGDNISGATTSRMTINPFRPADAGTYDVVVSNLCGASTSWSVPMSVVDGRMEQAPSMPLPRDLHAMAYDSGRNRMVLHGGYTLVQFNGQNHFQPSSETWERSGDGTWQVITDQGPGRRVMAAMAYDEARGVAVLYGGFLCELSQFCPWGNPGGLVWYTDTWEWNGSTWTQVSAGSGLPPARMSMTYDSVRQRVVMYGGQYPNGIVSATPFEWDGTGWTTRSTLPDPVFGNPPPVLPSPITYDRARNVYVLYRVFDTWELDGTGRWARRSGQVAGMDTTSMPGGMTFDIDERKTLMFNDVPSSPTTMTGALWEWTGSTWIRKHAPFLPVANAPVLAYDRNRRRTVMTGFLSQFGQSSDVWEWRYFTPDPTCALGPQ